MLVLKPLESGSSIGQCKALFVPSLGPPYRTYKAICNWISPVLGLELFEKLCCEPRLATTCARPVAA